MEELASKKSVESGIKRLVYRVPFAGTILGGLSKATIYRLARDGELTLVKIGPRASAITRASIAKFAEARGIPLPVDF